MKKTIYELNNKEGKALLKEFKKTSYYKQYFMDCITTIIILALICGFILGWYSVCDCPNSSIIEMISAVGIVICICFIALIAILFSFKRLDLVKEYYETKKEK